MKPTKKVLRCHVCHHLVEIEPHAVAGHVCAPCLERQSYRSSNSTEKGGWSRLPRFSFEFEIDTQQQWSDLEQATILLRYGFLRTQDGSVSDEYKSPIYSDLRGLAPVLPVLESLQRLVLDNCGTHVHVECCHTWELTALRTQVFGPLLTHLTVHQAETEAFWGRSFCSYARSVFDGTRYEAFNLQSSQPTLEFRLPRFRSAAQFRQVVRFCRAAVAEINRVCEVTQGCIDPEADSLGQRLVTGYQVAVQETLRQGKGGQTHV